MELLDADDIRSLVTETSREWGTLVATRREKLKISQADIAELVGVSVMTIRRIESGDLVPRDRIRFALAHVLMVKVDDLFPYPSRERIAATKVEAA